MEIDQLNEIIIIYINNNFLLFINLKMKDTEEMCC